MILDTNALSAFVDGDTGVGNVPREQARGPSGNRARRVHPDSRSAFRPRPGYRTEKLVNADAMTPSQRQATRILFIGNSYTTRNGLPRLLVELAADAQTPIPVEVATVFAGGASLRRHWNAGIAQKTLASAPWDYVVLQEQSPLPWRNPQRYHESVRLFAGEIGKSDAKIALYLTWSRKDAPEKQQLITRAVEEIGAEVGARVVPVGPAWHAAMQADRNIALYTDDGSHPTTAGSYLAACVFVVSLFGERPIGWSVSDRLQLDRAAASTLQEIAWAFRAPLEQSVRRRPTASMRGH